MLTAGILAVLLAAGGVLWYGMGLSAGPEPDPAHSRERSRALLERHAMALAAYRERHDGRWPDNWLELRRFTLTHEDLPPLGLSDVLAPQVGQYRYRQPSPERGDAVLVMAAQQPHPPVLLGETWDDGSAQTAYPAVAYGLDTDLQLVEMTPDEHHRRGAPLFTEDRP